MNLSRSFVLNRWILDYVPFFRDNGRVLYTSDYAFSEHIFLAVESAILFPRTYNVNIW